MPCVSSITRTKMTNADRLVAALKAAGVAVQSSTANAIHSSIGVFSRGRSDAAFGFQGDDEALGEVGLKYAELSAKEWVRRRGLAITEVKGNQMTIQARR